MWCITWEKYSKNSIDKTTLTGMKLGFVPYMAHHAYRDTKIKQSHRIKSFYFIKLHINLHDRSRNNYFLRSNTEIRHIYYILWNFSIYTRDFYIDFV